MLVLNRRIGETVIIADDISVTVLAVKGSQVRLGLTAPPTVPIHREEIYDRIQRERESATPHVPVVTHAVNGKRRGRRLISA
jgi:carbon storage regulator